MPETVAITASAGAGPASRTFSTAPLSPGGTSTRYAIPPGDGDRPEAGALADGGCPPRSAA